MDQDQEIQQLRAAMAGTQPAQPVTQVKPQFSAATPPHRQPNWMFCYYNRYFNPTPILRQYATS